MRGMKHLYTLLTESTKTLCIQIICSITATYVINSYSQETRVFILSGEIITSAEANTQGDT